jgi:SAM-dependent methyltransferase
MDDYYKYFNGELLYGDDFSKDEIEQWFHQEEEAYANMCGNDIVASDLYMYRHVNILYGYKYLKEQQIFNNVLGFGSSWGYEFLPIINKISKLTIIEPSIQTRSAKLGNIIPVYKTPNIEGKIDFPDGMFDLITCFSALHHIPNVTFVLNELFRVLQPGGYILLHEPIRSMGDWRKPRRGLTVNERGIPKEYLERIIKDANMEIIQKHFFSCMTSFIKRIIKKFDSNNRIYLYIDNVLSRIFLFNVHYHPTTILQKISPSIVFYVLRKPMEKTIE